MVQNKNLFHYITQSVSIINELTHYQSKYSIKSYIKETLPIKLKSIHVTSSSISPEVGIWIQVWGLRDTNHISLNLHNHIQFVG